MRTVRKPSQETNWAESRDNVPVTSSSKEAWVKGEGNWVTKTGRETSQETTSFSGARLKDSDSVSDLKGCPDKTCYSRRQTTKKGHPSEKGCPFTHSHTAIWYTRTVTLNNLWEPVKSQLMANPWKLKPSLKNLEKAWPASQTKETLHKYSP